MQQKLLILKNKRQIRPEWVLFSLRLRIVNILFKTQCKKEQ